MTGCKTINHTVANSMHPEANKDRNRKMKMRIKQTKRQNKNFNAPRTNLLFKYGGHQDPWVGLKWGEDNFRLGSLMAAILAGRVPLRGHRGLPYGNQVISGFIEPRACSLTSSLEQVHQLESMTTDLPGERIWSRAPLQKDLSGAQQDRRGTASSPSGGQSQVRSRRRLSVWDRTQSGTSQKRPLLMNWSLPRSETRAQKCPGACKTGSVKMSFSRNCWGLWFKPVAVQMRVRIWVDWSLNESLAGSSCQIYSAHLGYLLQNNQDFTAKTWKQTKCPLTKRIKKMWYLCTME